MTPDAAPIAAAFEYRSPPDLESPRAARTTMTGGARFQRAARMLTPADFDRCLRRPALFRSGSFALHLDWIDGAVDDPADPATRRRTAAPAWRLGLVIPKRYEASAVARNTIKRRFRDAFRRGREAWASEFGSADVVVRLQAPLIAGAAKPAVRKGAAKTPAVPPVPAIPARIRARDRFDPVAMLGGFVERLRSRGGRGAVVAPRGRPAFDGS